MAGKIKGITIEIGGDTTKLGKAIEEANKQSKSLQTELRGVNSLLKMDPTNITLIRQKQELLNQSVATTKEKLTTLKSTQEQVQKQFDKGEITTEQYRDFQREIISTENKLKKLTDEAKEFGSTSSASCLSASKKVEEFGGKVESAGKKMVPVTLGVTAIGTAGVAAFNDVKVGTQNVIKATGAVGEAAEELADSYEAVASNVVGDFGEIGSALGEVNTRFGYTGEDLETCTEKFMKFAEITGSDATTSVQLVARAMGDAGIESSEYSSVLDSLAIAAQASGIGVDKLTENLTKYGAPMRALGYDTNESIAIFSSWEKAGVNTEIAFSGMKKAISNFSAEGKDAKVEFRRTLDEIAACPDIASATTMAIEVFGQKAGPDLADAIQGGRFEFSEMLDLIKGADGTVDGTFNELVDGGYEAELAMQNAKLAMSGIGEIIMTMLAPILQSIATKLREFKGVWDSLSPSMQKIVVIIGGLVAAIGPVLILIGKMTTGVSSIIKVFGKLKPLVLAIKGLFMKLWAVLMANPIMLVIAAIVALVAIFVTLWNKCEWFRDFWIKVWNEVVKKAQEAWEGIKKAFSTIGEFFSKAWQSITDAFSNMKTWFTNKFNEAWNIVKKAFSSVAQFFSSVWNSITSAFNNMKTWFTNKFNEAWNIVKNAFASVGQFFAGVWNSITSAFSNMATWFTNKFNEAWNIVKNAFASVGQFFASVWNSITSAFSSMREWFSNKFNEAWRMVTNAFSSVGNFFGGVWTNITSAFSNTVSWFSSKFTEAWNAIKNVFSGVGSFFNGVWETIKRQFTSIGTSIGNAVAGAFKSVVNTVLGFAENTINGFIRSINGAIGFINKIPGVNIGKLGLIDIPMMAKGGTLHEGQAIVAEAGPEMIQLLNGKAVVTPLSKSSRNTAVSSQGKGNNVQVTQNNNYYSNKLTPSEVARKNKKMLQRMALT